MTGIIRMELIRMRRPAFVIGWVGLTALFAALINVVVFQVVGSSGPAAPADGPGVTFPDAGTLLSERGIVAGLASGASFFGVVALAFWALATASDHSTGLIRIIAAAEPRRWRLLVGKWLALAAATLVVTVVAVLVDVLVAPMAATAGGWDPTAWGGDLVGVLGRAGLDLYLSLLVWGTLGLALATLTRSAGVAIGVGIGYVLLFEAVIRAVAGDAGDWLPGSTITALAGGGSSSLDYGGALALGAAYVLVAGVISVVVTVKRDITD